MRLGRFWNLVESAVPVGVKSCKATFFCECRGQVSNRHKSTANVGVRSQIAINLPLSAAVCVTIPEAWSGIYVVPEMFNVTGQLEENTILTRVS
jgi:hypothetical protein